MLKSIMKWLAVILTVCAAACAGCAPSQPVLEHPGVHQIAKVQAGQPAPFTGWLLPEADFAMLLKLAEVGASVDPNHETFDPNGSWPDLHVAIP